jgi:hypothetical protein
LLVINHSKRKSKKELWKSHAVREFSDVRKGIQSGSFQDPFSWRAVYNQRQEAIREREAKLSERLKVMKEEHQLEKSLKTAKTIDISALTKSGAGSPGSSNSGLSKSTSWRTF